MIKLNNKQKIKSKKRITIFGAFDIVHPGHIYFLKQASTLGNVTAVLARDETITKMKGRHPFFSENKRLTRLKKLNLVKNVILGYKNNPYKVLDKTKPEIILLGADQKIFVNKLHEKLAERKLITALKRAKPLRVDIFKSSKIRPVMENADSAGFLNINKPSGITSHDVISLLRKKLNIKQIGHAGTLDPLASGVLICGISKATKLLDWWHAFPKTYQVVLELGKTSDTYDIEGEIKLKKNLPIPKKSEIKNQFDSTTGEIWQTPPPYSAKKINGQKAYELARAGKKVKLKKQKIAIHSINLLSYEHPFAKLEITCSSGTYIRSIIHNLGKTLKTGAIMVELTRTDIGPINIKNTLSLDDVNAKNWQNNLFSAENLKKSINKLYL